MLPVQVVCSGNTADVSPDVKSWAHEGTVLEYACTPPFDDFLSRVKFCIDSAGNDRLVSIHPVDYFGFEGESFGAFRYVGQKCTSMFRSAVFFQFDISQFSIVEETSLVTPTGTFPCVVLQGPEDGQRFAKVWMAKEYPGLVLRSDAKDTESNQSYSLSRFLPVICDTSDVERLPPDVKALRIDCTSLEVVDKLTSLKSVEHLQFSQRSWKCMLHLLSKASFEKLHTLDIPDVLSQFTAEDEHTIGILSAVARHSATLRTLNLAGRSSLGNAHAVFLEKLTQLHTLYLDDCIIDDKAMETMCASLSKLERLSISGCLGLTTKGKAHLSKLRSLTHICIGTYEALVSGEALVSDEDLASIQKIPGISTVHIWGSKRVTAAGLVSLSQCAQLKALSLMDWRSITDEGLAALLKERHENMELLYLSGSTLTSYEKTILELGKCEKLRVLSINRSPILADKHIEVISKLKSLAYLNIAFCENLSVAAFKHVAAMQSLRTLCADGCRISECELTALKMSKTITAISLQSCYRIDDACLKVLASFPQLRSLVVGDGDAYAPDGDARKAALRSSCKISDIGLKYLSEAPRLQRIRLATLPHITAVGIKSILASQSLSEVFVGHFTGCEVEDIYGLPSQRKRVFVYHEFG